MNYQLNMGSSGVVNRTRIRLVSLPLLLVAIYLCPVLLFAQIPAGPDSRHIASAGKLSTSKGALRTYYNTAYGLSLRYPKYYALKKGETQLGSAWQLAGNDESQLQPGRIMLVTLSMPVDAYPNSNLEGAFVNVSINRHLGGKDCKELLATSKGPAQSLSLNSIHFDSTTTTSGGTGNIYEESDYIAFENGICYEITLGDTIGSGEIGIESNGSIIQVVDAKDVQSRLRAILATITIRPPSGKPRTEAGVTRQQ